MFLRIKLCADLQLICRRIHAVVSGAKARRRDLPDVEQLHTIWESLEKSWDEFEALKTEPSAAPFREAEEAVRFADSWVSPPLLATHHPHR